ncbi:hypothetical protein BV898_03308 [Hypsibius exemplaris]|uniref:Uncharacterized protein n=1 Tax=Hypsibius exemplaris TaxID=2072580 RepID=A0A1W0X5Q1_HYPEX|nr:hypothetical protein BV898_03308 [Hypsibius exemplaris]
MLFVPDPVVVVGCFFGRIFRLRCFIIALEESQTLPVPAQSLLLYHKMETEILPSPMNSVSNAAAVKLAKLKAKLASDRARDRRHPSSQQESPLARSNGSDATTTQDLPTSSPEETFDSPSCPSSLSEEESEDEDMTRPDDMYSDAEEADGIMGKAATVMWSAVGGVIDAAATVIERVKGTAEGEDDKSEEDVPDVKSSAASTRSPRREDDVLKSIPSTVHAQL